MAQNLEKHGSWARLTEQKERNEEESNRNSQMESDTDAGVNGTHWWWTLASTGQLGWGIASFRKGYAGDSRLMPVKAFGVASLFVGSAASASLAFLQASGIRKVFNLPLYPFWMFRPFLFFSFLSLALFERQKQKENTGRRLARSGCKYQNATWYSFKNTSQVSLSFGLIFFGIILLILAWHEM